MTHSRRDGDAGRFATLYVSGAGDRLYAARRPTSASVSMSEVAETIGLIRDRVDTHLVVDADTGYGNALNVVRTVRTFERAGASANPARRSGFSQALRPSRRQGPHPGRRMTGKDQGRARCAPIDETLIIARTDAVAVEGFERAIARARFTRKPAPTLLFVEAPKTREELARLAKALPGVPLMANMVEGGKTPTLPAAELEAIGFSLVIFPGASCARSPITPRLLRVVGDNADRAVTATRCRLRRTQSHDRHAEMIALASATNASRRRQRQQEWQTLKLSSRLRRGPQRRLVQIATKWTDVFRSPSIRSSRRRNDACHGLYHVDTARPWCRHVRAADLVGAWRSREGCDR